MGWIRFGPLPAGLSTSTSVLHWVLWLTWGCVGSGGTYVHECLKHMTIRVLCRVLHSVLGRHGHAQAE